MSRRVVLHPKSSKQGSSRSQGIEHCDFGQYSKSGMHGNQAAPVTGRVLAEGVWAGYFYIPQKHPHSLDRESFTMIFQSHIDSSQRPKSENPLVAMLKHVTPFPPAFSPIGDYQTESPSHIPDRCVQPPHLFQTPHLPHNGSRNLSPQCQNSLPPRPILLLLYTYVLPFPQHDPKRTSEDSLHLTSTQISGVQHPISVSPSPPS